MGHKHGSLVHEISEEYKRMDCTGQSKHQAKLAQDMTGRIFSFNTMKAYIRAGVAFGKYCRSEYGCNTIDQCRSHVADYLQHRIQHCSAYTVKLDAAALAKLYRCSTTDFQITTPARTRNGITRSRQSRGMDRHFSPERHPDLVDFLTGTGLRRCEATKVTGSQLFFENGKAFIAINHNQAKGGRDRTVPLRGNVDRIVELMRAAGDKRVFPHISTACDVHSYRAEYACAMYRELARPLSVCRQTPFYDERTGKHYKNSVYTCRKDLAGRCYDRQAMLQVSRALGHNRIDVIAYHYLYKLDPDD